jgi:hypothetical protein
MNLKTGHMNREPLEEPNDHGLLCERQGPASTLERETE